MHTLLGLTSLVLVVLAGGLALRGLRRARGWSLRRDVQVLVLATPLLSLGLGVFGLHHFAGQICWLGAPPWDYTLGVLLPFAMGAVAVAALGLGLVRLAVMQRLVVRTTWPGGAALQALVDGLADRMGAPRVRVTLCLHGQPLALTHGLWRPTLVVSTWIVEQLDQRELESVLAHELAHAARRDYLVTWLATVLRDAFCYVPSSGAAYRQLRRERELACDDVAVAATRRPLALASALAKVWQAALVAGAAGPGGSDGASGRPLGAPALLGTGDIGAPIEHRIERLLSPAPALPSAAAPGSRALALGLGSSGVAGLLAVQAANAAVFLAPMGCGPQVVLKSLLETLR